MTARLLTWVFVASGFAMLSQSAAPGQDTPLPNKPNTSLVMTRHRDSPRLGIPKGELAEAQAAFKAYAKYYADVVAHPAVWKASQDLKADTGVKIPTLDGPEGILKEIDRYLLEPVPGGTKPNFEPGDYIRELGAAFDAELKNLIENHQERIVRVNAARVLAHVARSGAPAHFQTVTALLADPKTATEVKYYLIQAAGALLRAVDVYDMRMRKHAAEPKVIAALVKTLQDGINNPALVHPGFKPDTAAADQLAVVGFVRREAVRALGHTKLARLPNPGGSPAYLYPSHTLVRVAMGDPSLVPAPGPAECAEAVIGLCNMAPMEWAANGNSVKLIKEYNADIAVEAIIQGLITFAAPRAGNPSDRSLPWRGYAHRIGEAIQGWQPLFDPDFDFLRRPVKYQDQLVPASVKEMANFAIPKILAPIDNGGRVDLPALRFLLDQTRKRPTRKSLLLFEGVKETTIDFAPTKK